MTIRTLLMGLAFAGLAAWVSAQAPDPGTRLRHLQTNTVVLEHLLQHGLTLADQNDPLARAQESFQTTESLASELRSAVRFGDGDRVAEVTDLLDQVVRDAVVENLKAAGEIPGSNHKQLQELHRKAKASVTALADRIPTGTTFGDNPRVKSAREKLIKAADTFGDEPK